MTCDPAIHHQSSPRRRPAGRRSIRLKGHDYAGGGEYFITICAHREFVRAAGGRPFDIPGARDLIGRVWNSVGAPFMVAPENGEGRHETGPYIVMPDHFHGLVALPRGVALGDVVGAFKSRVVHEWIAGVKSGGLPEFPRKIWHRNYYERIVRSPAERARIAEYIRLNPVRLVFEGRHEGCPYRAFGNPGLWEMKKLGVLASGEGASCALPATKPGWALLSGFHSAQEREAARRADAPCIMVAAVEPESVGLDGRQLAALAEGRLLVVCPFDERRTTRENALARNRLVAEWCDRLWIPAARKGGSLEKLKQAYARKGVQAVPLPGPQAARRKESPCNR